MSHHDGPRPAAFDRLLFEDGHAEDVVDVTVGVDRRVEPELRPPAHGVVHGGGDEGRPRVDENQSLLGGEGRDVGERRDEGDSVGDLRQPTEVSPDGVDLRDVDVAAPQLVGQLEHVVRHDPLLAHRRCGEPTAPPPAIGWSASPVRRVSARGAAPGTPEASHVRAHPAGTGIHCASGVGHTDPGSRRHASEPADGRQRRTRSCTLGPRHRPGAGWRQGSGAGTTGGDGGIDPGGVPGQHGHAQPRHGRRARRPRSRPSRAVEPAPTAMRRGGCRRRHRGRRGGGLRRPGRSRSGPGR